MDVDAYVRRVESIVSDQGVFIQSVVPDDEPPFAYTVGMFARSHPEFLAVGLPVELAHGLLSDLSAAVLRGGMVFKPHDRVHRLIEEGHCLLVPIDNAEASSSSPTSFVIVGGQRLAADPSTLCS